MRRLVLIIVVILLVCGSVYLVTASSSRPSYEPVKIVDMGDQAPDFLLEDTAGNKVSLASLRGKVVLVNFWATWCPPCRKEMPALEALYKKLGTDDFAVLAVNQWEDPDHVFTYTGDLNVFPTFPILFDPESAVSEKYRVKGLPTSFLVDKQGRLAYRAVGGRDFDHPEVEKLILELQQQP